MTRNSGSSAFVQEAWNTACGSRPHAIAAKRLAPSAQNGQPVVAQGTEPCARAPADCANGAAPCCVSTPHPSKTTRRAGPTPPTRPHPPHASRARPRTRARRSRAGVASSRPPRAAAPGHGGGMHQHPLRCPAARDIGQGRRLEAAHQTPAVRTPPRQRCRLATAPIGLAARRPRRAPPDPPIRRRRPPRAARGPPRRFARLHRRQHAGRRSSNTIQTGPPLSGLWGPASKLNAKRSRPDVRLG